MTVDLTKLKAGDSVKLRCGVVLKIERDTKPHAVGTYVDFKGGEQMLYYFLHNAGLDAHLTTPFDILEIIHTPFDWDKVEQGDAFENGDKEVVYFVAHDFLDVNFALMGEVYDNKLAATTFWRKDKLTPRLDILNAKK